MSNNTIFTNKNYCICRHGKDFVVHNRHKEFKDGHTHVNNFNLAKIIIYTCIKGYFPSKSKRLINNTRVLESILRVCPNKHYNKFETHLFNLENKFPIPY